jgi:hypothetical protein
VLPVSAIYIPDCFVVLQSTLDFLEHGNDVHVPVDGVSSCNNDEVPLALERMWRTGHNQ